MKVFLVDDNKESLKLLGFALQQTGYEIAVATGGEEALAKIPIERPDIVILDVMMPKMNGMEVTHHLRSNAETANIPIILLTAKGQLQDKLDGFGAGADDYIVKPILPAELIVRINALMRRVNRYRDEAQAKARLIGFLGVKGGVGTTTLAVNVALALAQDNRKAILVDLTPCAGAASLQMGIAPRVGLSEVMDKEPDEITRRMLENDIESHGSGLRFLAMPQHDQEHTCQLTTEQTGSILTNLEGMAEVVVLDLGSGFSPATLEAARACHLVVLFFEGDAVALSLTHTAIERLSQQGVRGSRLGLVMVNRSRTVTTYTRTEIEEQFGRELLALITPAPEISFHANREGKPILISQPDTPVAMQFKQLSAQIIE
jgi:CheY-like chemotaxis protein/MinD-like ATPase involved in chromosome partitioning or flagellar assembly